MEVKFECGNTTIIMENDKLWLAIFRGKDAFEKIAIKEVLDDVKAVVKLFIGVDKIPEIDVDYCDEMTLELCEFNIWFLNLRNDSGEEKRYRINGKGKKS